jgi:hypothetical protein
MPDDQTIIEGDAGFIGMASRLNPLQLPAGMVQYVENMRLDRGVAQTRKGAKRLGDSIAAGTPPLTLPFALGDETTGPIIQTVYSGGILASGVFSSPNYNDENEYIVLCGPTSAFLYRQDETIEEIDYPANSTASDEIIDPTDTVSTIQAFNRFYLLREADPTLPGWDWKYTTSSGITVSGTEATIHITAHGLTAGMRVRIEEGNAAAFAGHEFDILTASTNSFTIAVPSGTASDPSAGIAIRRVKPPLWWDGTLTFFTRAQAGIPAPGASFKTLRSTGWATYLGNRLWVPDGRDTIAISDVLDPDLYDPFFQSFRANQGSNDYLVAIHPWVEGQALVFMRNSIWLANLTDTSNATGDTFTVDSAVSRLTLLTDEIGCIARRSIQTAGQFVFFLSDAGVYRLDTQLDLKLRANTQPLSDPIADQLEEINSDYAYLAVGRWWNNRYYLAVPIGDNAESNNTLFLWNALNSQWESRDTYAIALDELLVATYSSQRRLFAASRTGTLFLLDELDYGDEVPFANTEDLYTDIPATLITRRYGWQSLNAKRLTRAKASILLPPDSSCELRALTTDFDADFQIATLTNSDPEEEDYTLKAPLRCKAVGLDLQFSTLTGRPVLRQITAEATRSPLDQTLTRTLN